MIARSLRVANEAFKMSSSRGAKRAADGALQQGCASKQRRAGGNAGTSRSRPKEPQGPCSLDLGQGSYVDFYPRAFSSQESAELLVELKRERIWAQREIRVMGRTVLQPRLVAYCADDTSLSYTYSGATLAPTPWPPAALAIRARLDALLQQLPGQKVQVEGRSAAAGSGTCAGSGQEKQQHQQGQQRLQRLQGQRAVPEAGCRNADASNSALSAAATAAAEGCTHSHFNSCLLNWYRDGADHLSWHSDNEPLYGREPTIASVSLGAAREFMLRRNADPRDKYCFRLGAGDVLVMRGSTQQHWMHSVPKRRLPGERISLTFRHVLHREGKPASMAAAGGQGSSNNWNHHA